ADSPEKKKLIASEVQVFLQRGEELTILLEKKVPSYQRSSSFPSSASGLKSTINE
uniref:Uncharacterized protein n=1 Tax=Amphimedon queenslandica TaxID=400682 RepID=A0A1X7UBU1_AMPQE